MTHNNKLSAIEAKASKILKGHNGVYLDKRLYAILKKDFSGLSHKDFNEVLNLILTSGYSMERGLIRPLTKNEVEKQQKEEHGSGKKSGKGASERPRLPTKRGI